MSEKSEKILLAALVVQLIVVIFLAQAVFFPTDNQHKKRFYDSNVATLISPHSLREQLEEGHEEFIIVDTRERADYLENHIVTAINIVADENLVENFKKLQKESGGKEILTYCYTHVCMRSKKVGKKLAENGIFVRELGVGFNEWKNFWREWNYENEWTHIDINDFIVSGEEPGELDLKGRRSLLKDGSGCSTGDYSC